MKVLVVDDDREIVHTIRFSLERGGHDVSVVGTGAEALSAVTDEDPDAVLLDVVLPDLDGRTVARRILRERPDVPIVFLTGKTRPEEIAALESSADGVIVKPFDPLELSAAFERAVG